MSRSVRLKEHPPGTSRERTPDRNEFLGFNGTIEFKPYALRVDENGFIISSRSEELRGAKKVVLLGDSFFECAFWDEGARMCDVLNELSFSHSKEHEFLNAGYAASTTLNSVVTFVSKVLPLRPAAVVICADIFDTDCWRDRRSYWRPHPWYSPLIPVPTGFHNDVTDLDTDDYATLISGVSAMCDAAGIQLFVVAKPLCPESKWSETHKYYKDKIERLKIYNDVVRKYSKRNRRVKLLDLDKSCDLNWDDFYDANHLNSSGASKVARVIFHEMSIAASSSKVTMLVREIKRKMAAMLA